MSNSPPTTGCAPACWGVEGQAAKKINNPRMRGPVEHTAKRAAALAEKFEAARKR